VALFDWLYDPGFEIVIKQQTRASAAGGGMRSYDTDIADRLVALLRSNRDEKVSIERQRAPASQRTRLDALHSVDFLIREAAREAISQGTTNLTIDHFNAAFRKHYCKFWPFC
jgi:hypothetical protein